MHAEPGLGDRYQACAGRSVANFGFQANTLVAKLSEPRLEAAHCPRLGVPVAAPCDHRRGRDHEANEKRRNDPAATDSYAALRHALSRALLARGLRSTSSADGLIAFRFTSDPMARPPQVH